MLLSSLRAGICLLESSASAETCNPDVPCREREAALGKGRACQPTHLPASFSPHHLSPVFSLQILAEDAPQPCTAAAHPDVAHQGSTGPRVDGGSPVFPSSSPQVQVREPAKIRGCGGVYCPCGTSQVGVFQWGERRCDKGRLCRTIAMCSWLRAGKRRCKEWRAGEQRHHRS